MNEYDTQTHPVFAGRRKRSGFVEISLAVLEKTSHSFSHETNT